MEAHILVQAANLIARAPITEAWNVMAQVLVMYSSEEQFVTFDELASRITFTVDDIRPIVSSNR